VALGAGISGLGAVVLIWAFAGPDEGAHRPTDAVRAKNASTSFESFAEPESPARRDEALLPGSIPARAEAPTEKADGEDAPADVDAPAEGPTNHETTDLALPVAEPIDEPRGDETAPRETVRIISIPRGASICDPKTGKVIARTPTRLRRDAYPDGRRFILTRPGFAERPFRWPPHEGALRMRALDPDAPLGLSPCR
jgi:hypothetical protein